LNYFPGGTSETLRSSSFRLQNKKMTQNAKLFISVHFKTKTACKH